MGELRTSCQRQDGGALAHINFSQSFKIERDKQPTDYLFRHIIVGTVVDKPSLSSFGSARDRSLDTKIVVDMHAGKTPLTGHGVHHQSYGANEGGEI